VNDAGTVLDPTGIDVSSAAGGQDRPAVSAFGSSFLVAWSDRRTPNAQGDIFGARVSTNGGVLDPNGIPIATGPNQQGEPAVVWNGTTLLVVWSELRPESGTNDIYGARLNANGAVLDRSGFAVSSGPSSQSEPAVTAVGTQFLVVWNDYRNDRNGQFPNIFGSRVTAAGVVLDPAGILIAAAPGGEYLPAVAAGSRERLVVWQDGRTGHSYSIFAARVTGTHVEDRSGLLVSRSAAPQGSSAVAFDGQNFFVVWAEARNGTSEIFGGRLTRNGKRLDGAGIPIATGGEIAPAVAWNGTEFLVVWEQPYEILGARVLPDGTVLDHVPLHISPPPTASPCHFCNIDRAEKPDVAWIGSSFLVVWTHIVDRSPYTGNIAGARVSANGTVLDTSGLKLSTSTGAGVGSAVAWNGKSALVVWSEGGHVRGARVNQNGGVLGPSPIAISNAPNGQGEPDVASDGSSFQVVWTDFRNGTTSDIFGARVAGNGTVIDPNGVPLSHAHLDQTHPDIAFNHDYLVVWRGARNGSGGDIYGAHLDDGVALEPGGFVISATGKAENDPAVTGGHTRGFAATYTSYVAGPPYGSDRVFLRTLSR
jgi:hypothetical protein